MTGKPATAPAPAGRIDYIDLFKGMACLIIMYGHAAAPSVDRLTLIEHIIFTSLWFSAPMFFFASGMNVITFFEKSKDTPGFKITTFYLLAALILVTLSVSFSVNRGSLKIPNIFQGIAMGTAFTFLLVRTGLPNWALAGISLLLYLPWIPFWEAQLPLIEPIRSLPFVDEPAPTFRQWIDHIPLWQRWLGVHFSFLPWASYVLAGAAVFRSVRQNARTRLRWAALFAAMILLAIASIFMPRWESQVLLQINFPDMMVRNTPFFFFLWYGQCGLIFLAAEKWYRGSAAMRGGPVKRSLAFTEFLGRESFLFLVWHWAFLSALIIIGKWIETSPRLGQFHLVHYIPWLSCTLLIVLTMHWIVGVGEKWRARKTFLPEAIIVLFLFTFPGVTAFLRRGYVPFLATFFALPACLAFAFSYPVLRGRLRKRLTTPKP